MVTFPGNCFYGYTVMNKAKHVAVDFCSPEEAPTFVNDPRFMSLEEFDDGCCEVNISFLGVSWLFILFNETFTCHQFYLDYMYNLSQVTSKKKSIKYNLPVQIGFFVYQYAKLRMLAFFYDVIDEFISREDYCLLEMDTGNFRQIMCICNFNVILDFESDL